MLERLREQPAYLAAIAFVVGGALAGVIALLVTQLGGDDGGPDGDATPTAEETAVPTATAPSATTAATGTPAEGTAAPGDAQSVTDALDAFMQSEFGVAHVGVCPEEVPPEGVAEGYCSLSLYEDDELATFFVGPPFSEFVGEVVLVRADDGSWSATFVPGRGLEVPDFAVGDQAVVYGAGNCLNIRAEPTTAAAINSCAIDGTGGAIVDGPVEADGVTWWQLEGLGWASQEFLAPAAG